MQQTLQPLVDDGMVEYHYSACHATAHLFLRDQFTFPKPLVAVEQTLQPLVDDGIVEYHYAATGAVDRGRAHDACLAEMKHRHAW